MRNYPNPYKGLPRFLIANEPFLQSQTPSGL